jgi:serine protease AprX
VLKPAVREWPVLEIFSEGELTRTRKKIADQYGKTFASKASDHLCQALSTVSSFALEAVAPQPRPIILEFSRPTVPGPEARKRAVALGAEGVISPALLRVARRHLLRDAFIQQVAAVRTQLDRQTHPAFPAGVEALASPTVPSSTVEICWLNGVLRTYTDPRGLREVVEEKTLALLDVPRQLRADIDGTASVVGAFEFRKRSSVDGSHITVAVIDTEVDMGHPALANRIVQKTNFTKERFGNPAPHGTAVAGIIGSADRKFTGMAPGVTITNYKVLATDPSLNSDDFGGALAIQQALEDGAQVANCSWGSGPAMDGTGREAVACDTAWGLGLVIVKSSGNQGPGLSTLTTPADADGIIVVGATDRGGTAVQDYSSRGPAGTRVRPHLVAPGGTEFDGMHSCLVGGGFGDAGFGTSYAAPHVAGLAALLLAQSPGIEPDELRKKLLSACTRLPAGNQSIQGQGLVSLTSLIS